MKTFINSVGFRFFLFYIFFTYIIQFLFLNIYKEKFNEMYYGTDTSLLIVFFFIFLFIISIIFLNSIVPQFKYIRISLNIKVLINIGLFFVLLFYIIGSIYFFLHYSISFRANVRLRNVPAIIKILVLITPIVRLYVFFIFIHFLHHNKLSSVHKLHLIIILIGSILSLNSSTAVILILIVLLLLIKPSIFLLHLNIFRLLLYSFLLLIAIVGVIFMGTANKGGVDYAINFFTSIELLNLLLSEVFVRISTSFMSIMALINEYTFNIDFNMNIIETISNVVYARFLILVPLDSLNIGNEILLSVNRINYLILFKPYSDHAGATPGLIASIFYLPFFPFSFFMISFYTLLVIRAVNKYFYGIREYNIIAVFSVLYFCNGFFESPLGLLTILEPSNVAWLIFILNSFRYNTLNTK